MTKAEEQLNEKEYKQKKLEIFMRMLHENREVREVFERLSKR